MLASLFLALAASAQLQPVPVDTVYLPVPNAPVQHLALHCARPPQVSGKSVLFIHGASFPTMLAFGFEFAPGDSWLRYIDGSLAPTSSLWPFAEDARSRSVDGDVFDHISTQGRAAILMSWRSEQEAEDFANEAMRRNDAEANVYAVRIVRDYGMTDRREAPQYYPAR
jgi:hypothetical protein